MGLFQAFHMPATENQPQKRKNKINYLLQFHRIWNSHTIRTVLHCYYYQKYIQCFISKTEISELQIQVNTIFKMWCSNAFTVHHWLKRFDIKIMFFLYMYNIDIKTFQTIYIPYFFYNLSFKHWNRYLKLNSIIKSLKMYTSLSFYNVQLMIKKSLHQFFWCNILLNHTPWNILTLYYIILCVICMYTLFLVWTRNS